MRPLSGTSSDDPAPDAGIGALTPLVSRPDTVETRQDREPIQTAVRDPGRHGSGWEDRVA
jgi:hypothetical protein